MPESILFLSFSRFHFTFFPPFFGVFNFILFILLSLSFFSTKVYIFIYFIFQTQHLLFMCFIYAFWFLIYAVCISWLLYVCPVYYWAWVDSCVCVCVVSRVVHWKLQMLIFNFSLYIPRVPYDIHFASFASLSGLDAFCVCALLVLSLSFHFCFVLHWHQKDGSEWWHWWRWDTAKLCILPSFPLFRVVFFPLSLVHSFCLSHTHTRMYRQMQSLCLKIGQIHRRNHRNGEKSHAENF